MEATAAQSETPSEFPNPIEWIKEFFANPIWDVVLYAVIVVAVCFWLALAYSVYRDARRRIDDPWLVAMAVALGIFPPFLGPVFYRCFRPPEYLDDVRERALEIRAIEAALGQNERPCPRCNAPTSPTFLICPYCTERLRESCPTCQQPLDPRWVACPHCEQVLSQKQASLTVEYWKDTDALQTGVEPQRAG